MTPSILKVENLKKYFTVRRSSFGKNAIFVRAVDGISFDLRSGETLGLLGESGCGKSTIGRLLTRLEEPSSGKIVLLDNDISHISQKQMARHRQKIQMVFQDSVSSLNPRMSVKRLISEPFLIHKLASRSQIESKVLKLVRSVGLNPEVLEKFPHELSGGQCQRVSIARALAVEPEIIIADEAVSALDVSVRAQVINLMLNLQKEFNLSYIFISHDVAVVSLISHRIAVMYLGEFVEIGTKQKLIAAPRHPYTMALINSSPIPDPDHAHTKRNLPQGELPSPISPPTGCRFHPRCQFAEDRCIVDSPKLRELELGIYVACHFAEKISKRR